jgi:hypothetical protein
MTYVAFAAIALWASIAAYLFGRRINLDRKTLNNLAPGADFWGNGGRRDGQFGRDPALYTTLGQSYRRKAVVTTWVFLLWMIGGFILFAAVMSSVEPGREPQRASEAQNRPLRNSN